MDEIAKASLEEKYIEVYHEVNMLAVGVEMLEYPYCDEESIIAQVEYLDKLYRVYASIYKYNEEGGLILITERHQDPIDMSEVLFNPFNYEEFNEHILTHNDGKLVLDFTPKHSKVTHVLHVYYRWVPHYFNVEDRYLIIAGVSAQSVVNPMPVWLAAGRIITAVSMFIMALWIFVLLVRRENDYRANLEIAGITDIVE